MNKRLIVWAWCALTATLVSAQEAVTTNIKGRVVEAAAGGGPVPFAAIRLLGADSLLLGGGMTDADGRFALRVAGRTDGAVVTASCLGYETERVPLDGTPASDTLVIRLRQADRMLGEVTVKGAGAIRKADRRLVIPGKELTGSATDGMDLLRKMQLPRVTVNQMSGEISRTGGGKVVLCINGVQADGTELAALRPEDILRVEYHDAPGARYAGADAVIDCITRRREAGGTVGGDSFSALGKGKWASIDHLSAQYNCGQSAWTLTGGYMGQRRDNWVRDYEETWHYPDHEVSRREEGMPVSIGTDGLESRLNYSLAESGRYLFNARLGLDYGNVPAKEEGDRRTRLYTSDAAAPLDIYEHTTERSVSPSLDLYLQRSLSAGQQLVFDVVGTCIRTDCRRIYSESLAGDVLSESLSDIRGKKFSLIAEGFYEKESGLHRLSCGVRHLQACTDNRYAGDAASTVTLRQAESAAFGEYRGQYGIWSATGSLTASRIRYSQAGRRTKRYALQPSAKLACQPSERLMVRYGIDLRTQSPSLSDMSDVVQEVQAGMVRRGNPDLKPFRVLDQQLTADYDSRLLAVSLAVGYRHEYNPVMETVVYDAGLFVRTYENQCAFSRLSAEATITLRPWPKHLSLSVTPLLYRYISRGNAYLHTHTIGRLKVDADFTFGHWLLSYNTMVGPANTMYGEESLEEENMNMALVGYKRARWSVQAGVFNAFVREYWMETHNRNALTPFTSRAHCNRNTYFALKLSFNLAYGRQQHGRDTRIHNEDKETGIMHGTK